MREEQLRMAARAIFRSVNCFGLQAGLKKLGACDGEEVQVQAEPLAPMPGRSLRVEQQRVSQVRPLRFGLGCGLVKESVARAELAAKSLDHFFADFVAAPADRGSERRHQVLRPRPEGASHFAGGLPDHARQGSAPACMNRGDRVLPAICDQDRQAIRNADRQENSRLRGNESIAGARSVGSVIRSGLGRSGRTIFERRRQRALCRPVKPAVVCSRDFPDHSGMDLVNAGSDRSCIEGAQEAPSIPLDVAAPRVRGEAHVELACARSSRALRGAAMRIAHAESMDEPRKLGECRGFHPADLVTTDDLEAGGWQRVNISCRQAEFGETT